LSIPDTDQEEVARAIQRYDFLAMPVVDREQRLVGIVTVDDVIDILEQETTEDIYALGGGVQSGVKTIFQFTDRCPQARRLAVCVTLTNTVTGTIIKSQEDILGCHTGSVYSLCRHWRQCGCSVFNRGN